MEEEEEEAGGAGWIVSFADLMTLLFATFVVLYGIKPEGETVAFLGVVSSIREAFVEIPDDIPIEEKKGPIILGKAVFKHFRGDQNKPPVIKKYKRSQFALNVINQDLEKVRNLIEMMSKNKAGSLRSKAKESPVSVHESEDGFTLKLVSSYFYKPGAYRMDNKAIRKLKPVAEMLKEINQNVVIEGHTDSSPVNGEFSNWEISALRASFLARYFVNYYDFPAKKISAAGYADKKPLFNNRTRQGRKMNRRIEIKVKYDK